jgi:NAD(P)-dependent dehydrogenase (short-subunit alcohol dehydrogenase family)
MADLSGRVAVVTGANTGLGYETAKALASHGAHVVIASRNVEKAEAAKRTLQASVPGASLEVITVDLADLATIDVFADSFAERHDRLDLLINNAGIMMVPKGLTTDGFERQLGTNHLGHFALTGRLFERLASTEGARVVTVGSLAHRSGTIDFDDLMSERTYRPRAAYGRSKLANLLFAFELQRRCEAAELNVMSVAAHPGVSFTELGDHLLANIFMQPLKLLAKVALQDAATGALPTLRAATDPLVEGGEYFGPSGMGEVRGRATLVGASADAKNPAIAERLWDVSQELTGIGYP